LAHVDDDEPQLPLPSTQPKQFSCTICGKTYKHKRDLRRHVQLVHGVYPPTKVIIPKSAIQDKNNNNNIVTNETERNKKKKKKKERTLAVFDKVKKWMTIRV